MLSNSFSQNLAALIAGGLSIFGFVVFILIWINTSKIADNTSKIADNTSKIADNTSEIAHNTELKTLKKLQQ
jgi:hypothetical protein